MDPAPIKKSVLKSTYIAIIVAPFALGFIIAASLAAGPGEVFKALRGKKNRRLSPTDDGRPSAH